MQECYQVVFPGQVPTTKKGHIEPIDISVASRGSNKKVTNYHFVLIKLIKIIFTEAETVYMQFT